MLHNSKVFHKYIDPRGVPPQAQQVPRLVWYFWAFQYVHIICGSTWYLSQNDDNNSKSSRPHVNKPRGNITVRVSPHPEGVANLQSVSQIWKPIGVPSQHKQYHAWCGTFLGVPRCAYIYMCWQRLIISTHLQSFSEKINIGMYLSLIYISIYIYIYKPIRCSIPNTKSTTLDVVLYGPSKMCALYVAQVIFHKFTN